MPHMQERLPYLFKLAHNRSEAARMELAGELSELFLNDDVRLTAREEFILNELIDVLLKTKSAAIRAELISKFANATRVPRAVAMKLVYEAEEVSHNILLNNELLTDDDLIEIVSKRDHDNAVTVAQRKSINEAVADALVITGDLRVMQAVAENLGAKLSKKAINILAESARVTTSLQAPVMMRPETTEEVATKLFWWVPQDLRRYTLERFGIKRASLDAQLAKAIDEKLERHAMDKMDDEIISSVADWLMDRDEEPVKLLPKILRMGHFRLFNIMLSRMTKIDLATVDTLVAEPGGRALAAVCKSVGVEKSNFVSIFLLSRGARPDEQIVHPRELSNALLAFDRFTRDLAKEMVDNLAANPAYILRRNAEVELVSVD